VKEWAAGSSGLCRPDRAMQASVLRKFVAVLAILALGGLAGAQPGGQPTAAQPPEASPNDIDGPTMFATLCGYCHQSGGRAEGKGPKLAGSKRSDEYLIERIKKGKLGAMPAFGGAFTDGQIIAILAYIRGLDDDGN
jgi:mono/diheme cytochrome c family protein